MVRLTFPALIVVPMCWAGSAFAEQLPKLPDAVAEQNRFSVSPSIPHALSSRHDSISAVAAIRSHVPSESVNAMPSASEDLVVIPASGTMSLLSEEGAAISAAMKAAAQKASEKAPDVSSALPKSNDVWRVLPGDFLAAPNEEPVATVEQVSAAPAPVVAPVVEASTPELSLPTPSTNVPIVRPQFWPTLKDDFSRIAKAVSHAFSCVFKLPVRTPPVEVKVAPAPAALVTDE